MQLAIFIANFTFCSLFLGSCYGAPPVGESSSSGPYSRSNRFSAEEESFIINEMKSYPKEMLPIWGRDMWIEIAKNHSKMRQSNPEIPSRSENALARHFQLKMLNGNGIVELPADLIARISQKKKRGDDTDPTDPSENENQNVAPRGLMNRPAHLRDVDIKNSYTPEENEFLIKFFKNHPTKPKVVGGLKIWHEAAEQLKELRRLRPADFPQERSARALRERFRRMFRQSQKKLKNSDTTTENGEVFVEDDTIHRYTEEEDKFIIEELLKPSCTSIYSMSSWAKIKAQHDIKVRLRTTGFIQYRSVGSLKNRFVTALKEGKYELPLAFKTKFAKNFPTTEDGTPSKVHAASETSQAQNAGDDDFAIWDDMIEELMDTPYDFNFEELLK